MAIWQLATNDNGQKKGKKCLQQKQETEDRQPCEREEGKAE